MVSKLWFENASNHLSTDSSSLAWVSGKVDCVFVVSCVSKNVSLVLVGDHAVTCTDIMMLTLP